MFKLKKKKKGGDERQAGSLICNGEVGGKSEQRRDKERERVLCCPRVVKSLSPPSLGLGTGSISFGLLRKHWKRRLKSSGEDKGREEDFSKSSGSHAVLQLPAEIRDGQKEFDLTQSYSLHKSTHTRCTSVDAHKGRNKFAHVTDTHSLTL